MGLICFYIVSAITITGLDTVLKKSVTANFLD
jgi:hypothetical protein